ncbi:MAG: phenylacetate--CoA ligase family protein [Anaerovoracaceae bacterium]|jgi:phenylacetate-CoA ligase
MDNNSQNKKKGRGRIKSYIVKKQDGNLWQKVGELMKTQYYTPAEMAILQSEKLKKLLILSIRNVPAYQRFGYLLDEIETDPFKALSSIPILTKEDFRKDLDSFLSRRAVKEDLILTSTVGSTSKPLEFFMDQNLAEYYEAARYRGLSWWEINQDSRSIMMLAGPIDLNRYQAKKRELMERWLENRVIIPAEEIGLEKMDSHIEMINEYNPEYIYGYASALIQFSQLMLEQEIRLDIKLKAVVSTAESLHDFQRQAIETAFQCPVVNEYGARDGGLIAYQCREGKMHLTVDNAVFEVVDPITHEPMPPGESGTLLVTDLNDYIMPRLRYQIGDRIALSKEKCSCGVELPIMDRLDGREDDMLVRVDGKYVQGHEFTGLIKDRKAIDIFQVIQESPSKAILKMVLADDYDYAEIDGFIRDVENLLPQTKVDTIIGEEIPTSGTGKYRYTIREFSLEQKEH